MGITEFDISNMDSIMSGEHSWFTAQLLRLMAKADLDNLSRLASVFPEEFVEFCMWKWQGVPYQFVTTIGVKNVMNMDALMDHHKYRWLNPETGEQVSVELTHGRDF